MRYVLFLLLTVVCAPLASQDVRFAPASSSHERGLQRTLKELLDHSTPYAAPDQYAEWWSDVLVVCDCTPKVQLDELLWRKVAGNIPRERGAFWAGINVMFILGGETNDKQVIRHEMLHAMLGGDPDHRDKAWKRL